MMGMDGNYVRSGMCHYLHVEVVMTGRHEGGGGWTGM